MFFMFFFVLFNYTVLRDTKDSLVIPSSGAETVLFLKFWGVVPSAIIFMIIYSKLSNILSKENLFYATVTPFIVFFAAFALFIYPNREALHPHAFADSLQNYFPVGLHGLVSCFRNWTFSIFYIASELWGSVVLSLLFWGFANDITRVTEAKRFYSLFGLGGNLALLCSGPLIYYFSKTRGDLAPGVDPWGQTLNWLMALVVVGGCALIGIYWWMQRYVLTDPRFYDPNEEKKIKKAKPKMSLMESFAYILKSKYMLCLAVLVIAYGMSINLIEITFKDQLRTLYPNSNDYSAFMGVFSTVTGAATILMMLFVGSNVIRRLGWGFAAMITPIVLLITGVGFFGFILFRDTLGTAIAAMGTTPVALAVLFGAAQNIMSKSSKYSLFDPTKEMAYIPLDQEQKVKGKAAVDVVAARLGKSGGALVQQGLVVTFGTISAFTPYVAAILLIIISGWLGAASFLNKRFKELTGTVPGLSGEVAGEPNSEGVAATKTTATAQS
ncbi:MAG: NTP/NDP exchange transporter Npt1 [Chlamydiales bacterium]